MNWKDKKEKEMEKLERCCNDKVLVEYEIRGYYNQSFGKFVETGRTVVGYSCSICGKKLKVKEEE